MGDGDAPPSHIATMTLEAGENRLTCVAIDTANDMLYFGTGPGGVAKVVKVALGEGNAAPARLSSAIPLSNGTTINNALIDETHGYIYFTLQNPPRILKFNLDSRPIPPNLVAIGTLNQSDTNLRGGSIDTGRLHAYIPTGTAGNSLVTIALGDGDAMPLRLGNSSIATGGSYGSSVINPITGYLLAGGDIATSSVAKVSLGIPPELPARIASVPLESTVGLHTRSVIDVENHYAYFGTSTSPAIIEKIALGEGAAAPVERDALFLNEGENGVLSAAIDEGHGYAYFGTNTTPGRLVKVAVGDGDDILRRVGAVTLDGDEAAITSLVIDTANGHAYAGTQSTPARIVKIALGEGDDPPARLNVLVPPTSFPSLRTATIDTKQGYAYFGSLQPASVLKIALGAGSAPPEFYGSQSLGSTNSALCSVIDTARGHAYFGAGVLSGTLHAVPFGETDGPPGIVTSIGVFGYPRCGVIDSENGVMYLGAGPSSGGSGALVKVGLGNNGATPSVLATVAQTSGSFTTAVMDTEAGYAYFAKSTTTNSIIKVATAQKDRLKATKMILGEPAVVTDMRFHSHAADGEVRLSLFDDSEPKRLLWQSAVVTNTTAGSDIVVPITEGFPGSLTLFPATYWLAWQVKANADVPSYTPGTSGDGFTMLLDNNSPPPTPLAGAAITVTSERWTQYITYTLVPGERESWELF